MPNLGCEKKALSSESRQLLIFGINRIGAKIGLTAVERLSDHELYELLTWIQVQCEEAKPHHRYFEGRPRIPASPRKLRIKGAA